MIYFRLELLLGKEMHHLFVGNAAVFVNGLYRPQDKQKVQKEQDYRHYQMPCLVIAAPFQQLQHSEHCQQGDHDRYGDKNRASFQWNLVCLQALLVVIHLVVDDSLADFTLHRGRPILLPVTSLGVADPGVEASLMHDAQVPLAEAGQRESPLLILVEADAALKILDGGGLGALWVDDVV